MESNENKKIPNEAKQAESLEDPQIIKDVYEGKETSDGSSFQWNFNSVVAMVWFGSIFWVGVGKYLKTGELDWLALFALAPIISYCCYMISLIAARWSIYKLRRIKGKRLSSVEYHLICSNLLDNAIDQMKDPQRVPYFSYMVTDLESGEARGYVIVVGGESILWDENGGDSYDVHTLQHLIKQIHERKPEKKES